MKRNLVIGLLVTLLVAVTGATFAFWASGLNVTQASDDAISITVGTGDTVTSTVSTNDPTVTTDALVPTTITPGAGETNEIVITYNVTWAEVGSNNGFDGTAYDLEVSVNNLLVGGVADSYDLVNAVVGGATSVTLDGSAAVVTVTVTLDEPLNQTQYDAVAGKTITFNVSFSVTVPA